MILEMDFARIAKALEAVLKTLSEFPADEAIGIASRQLITLLELIGK